MLFRRVAAGLAMTLVATGGALALAQSAQAAVPDKFGFALYSGAVVSEQFPAATTVLPNPPGRFIVIFPGQAAAGGVVHVTAVQDGLVTPPARWCQAENWVPIGPDEYVFVSCYAPGGALDSSPGFSVMFSSSTGPVGGGLYGYTYSSPGGAIINQYNSVGAANSVAHVGVGLYSIGFIALGTPGPNDGGLEVTAVNQFAGARCKVGAWSSSPNGQFARILCFDATGVLADNAFTATYQFKRSLYGPMFPPTRFGYLWSMPALGPPPTNFNSTGPANILSGAPPMWTVVYPNLAVTPGNVQVTTFGATADFCTLRVPWVAAGTTLVYRVACYNAGGGASPSGGFLTSYSSLF